MEVPLTQGPVGRTNYRQTLPLAPGEVVLTFDDGPMPRRTAAVLDALRAECVKATFFVVGTMVASYPDILRRTAAEGHTIATHTWSHAYLNRTRSEVAQRDQISGGLLAARSVLGDANPSLSPFFRYPGLGNTRALDRYVGGQHLIPFSIDVDGEDWKRITPAQVVDRVMGRLDVLGRGIILLHDIQARTVTVLPELLRQLKANGYRVVHVTAAPGDTRLALDAIEPPRSQRIQVALGRLDQQQAVRLASREDANPSASAAAALGQNTLGRAHSIQMASAESDGTWPTMALRGSAHVHEPIPLSGRRGHELTAEGPIAFAAATGSGNEGLSGMTTKSGGRTSESFSHPVESPQVATVQAERTLPSARSDAEPRPYPRVIPPKILAARPWVDPHERSSTVTGKPSVTLLSTGSATKVAAEIRASLSSQGTPPNRAVTLSSGAMPRVPTSKPPLVQVAAIEPQPEPIRTAALATKSASSFEHGTTPRLAIVGHLPSDLAPPRTAVPVTTDLTAEGSNRHAPATQAFSVSSLIPSSPTAKPAVVPIPTHVISGQTGALQAVPRTLRSPTAGPRAQGFVVLAVAPGAGPGFQEVTLQR
ncbi:polysaccharide deacetylase family protein [Methylobacterium sp. CM6247]